MACRKTTATLAAAVAIRTAVVICYATQCTPSQALDHAAGGGDTHLRVDGEPWQQELPDTADGGPLRVHIKLAPVPGRVLVNREGLPPKVCMQRGVCPALTAACVQQRCAHQWGSRQHCCKV